MWDYAPVCQARWRDPAWTAIVQGTEWRHVMRVIAFFAALLTAAPAVAPAALKTGVVAPDFTTGGALAGKPFRLNLREQLRKGPVVLYFFPKAFTEGCTLEAKAFSDASYEFRKAGARVIGLSADDYPTLARFSKEACRDAFPVATASAAMIAAYDVKLQQRPGLSNRTSYVIAPNGRVIYAHSDLNWQDHVKNTLAAVKAWRARQR
jgi:peroxiredoxin Q/BCP